MPFCYGLLIGVRHINGLYLNEQIRHKARTDYTSPCKAFIPHYFTILKELLPVGLLTPSGALT
jgi:hypothetical protein